MEEKLVQERTAKEPGYGSVAKFLHWLIVALLIAQFAVAWTMPDINPRTPPNALVDLHFSIGVTILFVALLRLLWRWRHPVPLISDNVPVWQDWTARATHALLYLLLFVLPILGWIDAGFRELAINFYAMVTIPPIVGASRALAGRTGISTRSSPTSCSALSGCMRWRRSIIISGCATASSCACCRASTDAR